MKKNYITTLVLLIVAFAAAGLAYTQFSKPEPAPVQPINTNQGDEIDTSNWKTYRNEEYGCYFKYPSEWEVSSPTAEYKNSVYILLERNPDDQTQESALFSIEAIRDGDSEYILPIDVKIDNDIEKMQSIKKSKEKVTIGAVRGYEVIGTLCTQYCINSPKDLWAPFAIFYTVSDATIYKFSYSESINGVGSKVNIEDWKYYEYFSEIISTLQFFR